MARTVAKEMEQRRVNGMRVKLSASAVAAVGGVVKRKPRFRPGTVALREIRKYQRTTDLMIQKKPFYRLVKEIGNNVMGKIGIQKAKGMRYTKASLDTTQEIVESWMTTVLEDAQMVALHGRRVKVQVKDLMLVMRMRHETPRQLVDCIDKKAENVAFREKEAQREINREKAKEKNKRKRRRQRAGQDEDEGEDEDEDE